MITAAEPRHAEGIAAVYAPYVTDTVISFDETPPSAAEILSRMNLPWLVALDDDGEVVGFSSAGPYRTRPAYRWAVECSVYVAPSHHRRGLGTALYTQLFDTLRIHGYVQAFAGIALPNEASVGMHEALGFAPVGVYRQVGFKLGQWHDVGWWQLQLVDPPAVPHEPQ
jgi:L-amino acid N-acyltransferase YncA